MIQESFSPVTNQFINHCFGLKFEAQKIFIDEEIDLDQCCNTFLNKYIINDEDDEDGDEDDGDDEDEEDKAKEQKMFEAISKVCKSYETK